MNKFKKWAVGILAGLSLALSGAALAGCGQSNIPADEAFKNYYYLVDDGSVNGFSLTEDGFVLNTVSQTVTGTYVYDGKTGTFTMNPDAAGISISGVFKNGVFTLTVDGVSYVCTAGDVCKVVYYTDGGTSIPAKYVAAGSAPEKPTDPVKAGYVFAGWYQDAGYASPFTFGAISADTNVYARFVPQTAERYTVNFVGGGEIASVTTNDGGLIDELPAAAMPGKTFVGWWMSDYDDANKLTCQYTDQVLVQNTTLYAVFEESAPAVSVTGSGITWESRGMAATYTVVITPLDGGDAVTRNVNANRYDYDFSAKPAGEYKIEVTYDKNTTTVYYKNKALAKVSLFSVDGFDLIFNKVAGAEKYLVTVRCGNRETAHEAVYTDYDNGDRLAFNFYDCEMTAEGITFVVKAVADGYLTSVSDPFSFERRLDKVTGIAVNAATEQFTWEAVEHADYYMVKLGDGDYKRVDSLSSITVKEEGPGDVTMSVYAVAHGYNPSEAAEYTYRKTTLASPDVSTFAVEDNTLTWAAVDGAAGYIVQLNGQSYNCASNSLDLDGIELVGTQTAVSVCALAENAANNSLYSDAQTFAFSLEGQVSYVNGEVIWGSVFGADKYEVKVNDGAVKETTGYKAAVTLTQKGVNTISVRSINASGVTSEWETITVTAYAVALSYSDDADTTYKVLFRAVGDELKLDDAIKKPGYTFKCWSAEKIGVEYGKTALSDAGDLRLYAQWTANKYTIVLSVLNGTLVSGQTEYEVTFDKDFVIGTATPGSVTMAFAGWYTEPDGQGVKVADHLGYSTQGWNVARDTTVYAFFAEVFQFKSINNGTAYSVTGQKAGMAYVTEVTVPTHYNGLPVLKVEANAFYDQRQLVTVNIPDTVDSVVVGIRGLIEVGSAFYRCLGLKNINVYYVVGNHDRYYASVDGILFYNNPYVGVQMCGYPYAREATRYEIPAVVSVQVASDRYLSWNVAYINAYCFWGSGALTEVAFPYTIVSLAKYAIYSNTNIEKVSFGIAPEGVEELPLTIEADAFYSSKLVSLTLPARLNSYVALSEINNSNVLAEINVVGEGGNIASIDGVVVNAEKNTILYVPVGKKADVYRIPSGVTSIGESAFERHGSNFGKIVIPAYVTYIAPRAFAYCHSGFEFEGTETDRKLTIDESAFYYCSTIETLVLPANAQTIASGAFSGTYINNLVVNSAGVQGADGAYTLDFADGAFTTKDGSMVMRLYLGANVPVISIPSIFGADVERIEVDAANPNYTSIDSVVYDKNVTDILYFPINRTGEYTTPSTLEKISDNVFANRRFLNKVTVTAGVESIGEKAFANCTSLTEIVFEQGSRLYSIADNAFADCTSLTSVVLPVSLGSLSVSVFSGCTALSSITVEEGNEKYATLNSILYEIEKDGETIDYSTLIFVPAGISLPDGTLALPKGLKVINDYAFESNTSIKSIVFPEGLSSSLVINSYAFNNCVSLESVAFPSNVAEIRDYAFNGCKNLSSVTIPNTVTYIGKYAFRNCAALTNVVFESGNEEAELVLGTYAFSNTGLESVALPERLKTLSNYTFYESPALGAVALPVSLETIGDRAFYGTALSSVVFAEGSRLTSIGTSAFYGLSTLKSISLPESLVSIGTGAFYGTGLVNVIVPASVTTVGGEAFRLCADLEEVIFPEASQLTALSDHLFTGSGIIRFTAPASVQGSIPGGLFLDCARLEYVDFSKTSLKSCVYSSVSDVFQHAFGYCTSLTTVLLPDTLTSLVGFKGCTALEHITLPANLEILSDSGFMLVGAFEDCTSLKSVVIPKTVTVIGIATFRGCTSLESVVFETYTEEEDASKAGRCDLAKIQAEAFNDTALTSFSFPEVTGTLSLEFEISVTKVVFMGRPVIVTVTTTYYDKGMFAGCENLKSIYVSQSVKSNLQYALYMVPDLETISVALGHPVYKTIGDLPIVYNAAGNAVNVAGVIRAGEAVVAAGTVSIAADAFKGNFPLKTVYLPDTLTTIGERAFNGCFSLESVYFYKTEVRDGVCLPVYEADGVTLKPAEAVGLTSVGDSAFLGDFSLVNFTIPSSVTSLGAHAFEGAGFVDLVVPDSVVSYGDNVFANCAKLASVTLQSDFTAFDISLGVGMFENCKALRSVTFAADTNKLAASMFNGCSALASVAIPSGVTEIPDYAFAGTGLSSVSLTNNVLSIGDYAFARTPLVELVLPVSVSTIGSHAFYQCELLGSFTVAASDVCPSLSSVGSCAFSGTAIASLDFSFCDNFVLMGDYAFADAPLVSVVLPGHFESFGAGAFEGCSMLAGLTYYGYEGGYDLALPASVTNVSQYAFAGTAFVRADLSAVSSAGAILSRVFRNCPFLAEIAINRAWTEIPEGLFSDLHGVDTVDLSDMSGLTKVNGFADSSVERVILPGGVTEIAAEAFAGSALGSIVLPESCVTVGASAFSDTKLTQIDLSGVLSLGNDAFRGCAALEEVIFNNALTEIPRYAFYGCASLKEANLPVALLSLGTYAFFGSGIENVIIPAQLTEIPAYAFSDCVNLVRVTSYASYTSVGKYAFNNCASLTEIDLPDSLASIGDFAFNASGLVSVVIPESVTSVGIGAFSACSALTQFVSLSNRYIVAEGGGLVDLNKQLISYPEGRAEIDFAGVATIGQYAFAYSVISSVVIPASITAIGPYSFAYTAQLKSVTFEPGCQIIAIGYDAFRESGIESIVIPASVTSVEIYAFQGCSALKSLGFEAAEDRAGLGFSTSAFEGCGLEEVTLPSFVRSLGYRMFAGCASLTSVVIEGENITVGKEAFLNCTSLTTVEFRNGVSTINESAFSGCTSITSFDLTGVTIVGVNAFAYSGLTSAVLPATLTFIGSKAFQGSGLETVVFEEGFKLNIPEGLFRDCAKLTSVVIPASVNSIGTGAFSGCTSLASVSFAPRQSKLTIGERAFAGCTAIETLVLPETVFLGGIGVFEGWTAEQSVCVDRTVVSTYGSWAGYTPNVVYADGALQSWLTGCLASVVWKE